MKTILVAYDKKYGIGAANDLLWQRDLPADLKHFKDTTMGGAIIMGRKTYDSIGRPLPGRQNIVVSRDVNTIINGVAVVNGLDAAYSIVEPGREVFIMGGGQVYEQALADADRIMATELQATFDQADVFFPPIDPAVWHEESREHHLADDKNRYDFDFVTYVRR